MPAVTLSGVALLSAWPAWSAEPATTAPQVMFQQPSAPIATTSAGNLNRYQETTAGSTTSFPKTSSAPLVWRAKRTTVEAVAPVNSAAAGKYEHQQTSAQKDVSAPATIMVDGQVRPVAFTLQLNNEKPAINNKPRIRQVSGPTQSVLTNPTRATEEPTPTLAPRPAGNAADPFKDPFGDRLPVPAKIDLKTVRQNAADDGDAFVPPRNPLQNIEPKQPALPQEAQPADEPKLNVPNDEDFLPNAPKTEAPQGNVPKVPEDNELRNIKPPPDLNADEPPPGNVPKSIESPEDFEEPLDPKASKEKNAKDDCDRIYNDRNACREMDACRKSSARLAKDTLLRMTREQLDITAPYKPDADTPEEIEKAEARRAKQMASAGAREWRDRNDRVLAHGTLVLLKNNAAVVRDASGSEASLALHQLGDDELAFIGAWYELPAECTIRNPPFRGREFVCSTFTWKASSLCHKPLYFEDVQLERYGHTAGPLVQPVASFAHFFGNIAILPYKMGINPPHECQYTLGYYRPGSCAPWMIPPVPLSVRGGLSQAGAIVGGAAMLP
jgi:hypothetical protein